MKKASVSQAKNNLSGFLGDIQRGETVLITHRGTPVARIDSCRISDLTADQAAGELIRQGIVTPPRAILDVDRILAAEIPRLADDASASQLVVDEREQAYR